MHGAKMRVLCFESATVTMQSPEGALLEPAWRKDESVVL